MREENENYYNTHDEWLDRYELSDEEKDRRAGRRQVEGDEIRRRLARRRKPRPRPEYKADLDNPFDKQGRWQPRDRQEYIQSDKRLSRYERYNNYNDNDDRRGYQDNYRSRPPTRQRRNFRTTRDESSRDRYSSYDRRGQSFQERGPKFNNRNQSKDKEEEDDFDDENYFDRNELRYVNSPADIEHQKRLALEMSQRRTKRQKEIEVPMDETDPELRQKRFHTLIVQRASISELQKLLQLYINDLNTTTLCICLVQIARILQKDPTERTTKAAMKLFQWQLLPLCNEAELKNMPTPLLASCIWAMARSQICAKGEGKTGLQRMFQVAKQHSDYSAENIALIIWAIGESQLADHDCLNHFIDMSMEKLEYFDIDALVGLFLAVAKMQFYNKDFLQKFFEAIKNRKEELTDREIATVMKAFECHRYKDEEIFEMLSNRVIELYKAEQSLENGQEARFRPRSAGVILQAWSQLRYMHDECYQILIKSLDRTGNAWALTTALHSLAVMNRPSEEVQKVLDDLIHVISSTGKIKSYWLKYMYTAIIIHESYGGKLEVPPKVREAGKKQRISMVKLDGKYKNMLADKVHGVLRRIHLIGQRNVFIGKGDVRVELQVKGFQGFHQVAIQFCSRASYLFNDVEFELGRSLAYRKLLEKHGFKVIIIQNFKFTKMKEFQRRNFLKSKFKELNLEVEGQRYMDALEAKRQQVEKQKKQQQEQDQQSEQQDDQVVAETDDVEDSIDEEDEDSSQFDQEDLQTTDIDSEGVMEEGQESDEVVTLGNITESHHSSVPKNGKPQSKDKKSASKNDQKPSKSSKQFNGSVEKTKDKKVVASVAT
eukprot:TRINITY_DN46441_c0_g3_i1.p1 TRINITY_DN46441_c0_g3~~TRINITY_DN46441_c0_g3_i1.p1  ORF type:complete len:889 (-),score=123.21 TRINITY_DN46441_c0_g3_i1:333-2819(-)